MPRLTPFRLLSALLLASSLWLAGCRRQPTTTPQRNNSRSSGGTSADNSNLLLGNPSGAGTSANNFLLNRAQYTLSYNATEGGPNWVAWHLEERDLGDTERSTFRPDSLLPASWQIRPTDYRSSGYDRGHLCPSGDRTRNTTDNAATFMMSNMLPQAPALNQKVWKQLEDYCRDLAGDGNELYIIAGGVGSRERIAKGRINVPKACWKIIVVLPKGNSDLARIGRETRVIAVIIPNEDTPRVGDSQWSQWTTSVAQLQTVTGYDFLSALPDDIERDLESKRDRGMLGRGVS